MPTFLNAVATYRLLLYPGDDQLIYLVPDITNDVSGIPIEDWEVVAGFYPGRLELENTVRNASIQFPMSYIPPEPPSTTDRFSGTLSRAQLLTMGANPGRWTGGIWRVNPTSVKLLAHLECDVAPHAPLVTSSTSTTTTTT